MKHLYRERTRRGAAPRGNELNADGLNGGVIEPARAPRVAGHRYYNHDEIYGMRAAPTSIRRPESGVEIWIICGPSRAVAGLSSPSRGGRSGSVPRRVRQGGRAQGRARREASFATSDRLSAGKIVSIMAAGPAEFSRPAIYKVARCKTGREKTRL